MSDKELIKEFPFIVDSDDTLFTEAGFTFLDDMPQGWKQAFGIELCKTLKSVLEHYGELEEYKVLQVKEKYGTLRWYDNSTNPEVCKVVSYFEKLSAKTCAVCGATVIDCQDYPLCESCIKKIRG